MVLKREKIYFSELFSKSNLTDIYRREKNKGTFIFVLLKVKIFFLRISTIKRKSYVLSTPSKNIFFYFTAYVDFSKNFTVVNACLSNENPERERERESEDCNNVFFKVRQFFSEDTSNKKASKSKNRKQSSSSSGSSSGSGAEEKCLVEYLANESRSGMIRSTDLNLVQKKCSILFKGNPGDVVLVKLNSYKLR